MSGDLLTISRICRSLPGARGSASVSPSTVTRWIVLGCPGRTGTRVRLRAVRAGGRWLVAPADLDAFFAALAADPATPGDAPSAPPKTSTAERSRRANASCIARRA